LRLLGPPDVRHDGTGDLPDRKALALLIYLTVERGLPFATKICRPVLASSDEERGRDSLRRTLAYLRDAVQDHRKPDHSATSIAERDVLGFQFASAFDLDLVSLQGAWSLARASSGIALDDLVGPASDRGGPLPG